MAGFWIPCLILLGFWRHGPQKFPLRYGVEYWSMVFPLGMYTVCTHALGQLFPFPFFQYVAAVAMAAALLVWCLVFLGLSRHLWQALSARAG